jgi:hypothetical protein
MEKDIFEPLNYFFLLFFACAVFIIITFLMPINLMRIWNKISKWRLKK